MGISSGDLCPTILEAQKGHMGVAQKGGPRKIVDVLMAPFCEARMGASRGSHAIRFVVRKVALVIGNPPPQKKRRDNIHIYIYMYIYIYVFIYICI